MKKSVLSITPSVHKSTIAPEIYGQFSEHLGRCIYDGVYGLGYSEYQRHAQ